MLKFEINQISISQTWTYFSQSCTDFVTCYSFSEIILLKDNRVNMN